MTDGLAPYELSERIVRMEERMKTMQAEYKTDIALLEAANERRAATQTRWLAGIGIAIITAIIGGFGLLGWLLSPPPM